ncbi:hypothetical protein [Novosphingobium sp. KN65.2]|uniref:hypothetical protein n=1 Tax=Novosphingobium sp. KN65.2 TaxID=1478134 RepID=UPI0005E13551|nr:hypothetical protein [Novosphingobium sp. KN65.2]CDO35913.1 conserved exported hypothetical protein [Novosphingobium sp. KN65.2]
MKTRIVTVLAGLAVSLLPAQSASGRPSPFEAAEPIALPNVEDMAVLPGGRWLIASSMSSDDVKPALYAVETATARFEQLYPDNGATSPAASPLRASSAARSACPAELASGEFSGHGISYRPTSDRGGELYVVNHGGRESIEIFDIELPPAVGAAPKLRWKDCIAAPAGTVGNGVAWTRDGRIYATVTPLVNGMPRTGDVRYWTASAGWTSLPGSAAEVPTGIAIAPDGGKIYVSSFPTRKVIELTPGKIPARREVGVTFGADNLSVAKDGAILVGGLDGKPADIMRSCPGSNSPTCRFTGYVARIDPTSLTVTCTLSLGPTVTTTATQVGELLWFGSSRAPRIWRAPAAALKSCPGWIDVGAGRTGHE